MSTIILVYRPPSFQSAHEVMLYEQRLTPREAPGPADRRTGNDENRLPERRPINSCRACLRDERRGSMECAGGGSHLGYLWFTIPECDKRAASSGAGLSFKRSPLLLKQFDIKTENLLARFMIPRQQGRTKFSFARRARPSNGSAAPGCRGFYGDRER